MPHDDFDAKARVIVSRLVASETETPWKDAIADALRRAYSAGYEKARQEERDFIADALI